MIATHRIDMPFIARWRHFTACLGRDIGSPWSISQVLCGAMLALSFVLLRPASPGLAADGSSLLGLPYAQGQTRTLSGGPHNDWDISTNPWNSLDLAGG